MPESILQQYGPIAKEGAILFQELRPFVLLRNNSFKLFTKSVKIIKDTFKRVAIFGTERSYFDEKIKVANKGRKQLF